MMIEAFDIIVIGGGPGGYVAAIRASQLKKKVALVEEKHLGGICLNWGCIPTKSLLRTAEVNNLVSNASKFGLDNVKPNLNWDSIIKRSRDISKKLSSGISYLMTKNNIKVYDGRGVINSKKDSNFVLDINYDGNNTEQIKSPKVILATGARAKEFPGVSVGGRIWTYREAMVCSKQPGSLIVVGSGAIGIEFASFFLEMGTKVTVIEYQDRILPMEDKEISEFSHKVFANKGMNIITGSKVSGVKDNGTKVSVSIEKDGVSSVIESDNVLIAIGIKENIENLGLESMQVKLKNNHISVDTFSQTSERGIYAIGDVSGPPWLAHKASHEGMIAVDHACGLKNLHQMNISSIPGCTYSLPQVASVGFTEETCKQLGYKTKVGRFSSVGNGKALSLGEADHGMVKVIFDLETGELLGAHMVGHEVAEQIQGFVIAKNLEATEDDIINTVFPHPTLSEMMHESVLDAFDRPIHK